MSLFSGTLWSHSKLRQKRITKVESDTQEVKVSYVCYLRWGDVTAEVSGDKHNESNGFYIGSSR